MTAKRPESGQANGTPPRTVAEQSPAKVRTHLKRVDEHVAANRRRLAQLKTHG
jgi:hypothetical protein